MKPSIGRTIIVKGSPAASNGSDVAPAIITRVWSPVDTRDSPALVNATAFPDLATPQVIASVRLYDTEIEADESGDVPVAFWPERMA